MSWISPILDLLFPPLCPVCSEPLEHGTYLCATCLSQLDRTNQAMDRDNATEVFFQSDAHFAYGGCWLNYQKGTYLQQLILHAKFGRGNPMLFLQLGQTASNEWIETGFFDGIDRIIPIPLHPRRLRTRGFNQAEYIAQGIHRATHIPLDTEHVTRTQNNRKQSQSTKAERLAIDHDLFHVNHPEELYGQTILLVDDIITTGATIQAALHAFHEVYGCKIVVFALAKAK